MKIGRLLTHALVSLLMGFSSLCHAGSGFVKGKIEWVRVHDGSWGGWAPPSFWFTLTGVTNAGTCGLWYGKVLFQQSSKESLLTVMMASATGRELAVFWDDTQQPLGVCRAMYMTMGDSAPLF